MSKTRLLLAFSVFTLICAFGVAHAQDYVLKFDSMPNAPYAPAPDEKEGLGDPDQYAPSLPPCFKPSLMPKVMPGWGPYGDYYGFENKQNWTYKNYNIGKGDIIIAVNDRRVRSENDLNKAMAKAGDYVVLTVVDVSVNKGYCIGLRIWNHNLPLVGMDNFFLNNGPQGVIVLGCLSSFNGYVYKPTCPFPVN